MTPPSYLAIDLGASSGRAVLGTLDDAPDGPVMRTREVHRFRTPLIEDAGHLSWDLDALWAGILHGIAEALVHAPTLRSISVDSWAVDYVPLGAGDAPLRRPYAYRDPRTKGRLGAALVRAGGAATVYARTGIQLLELNTLVQIVADVDDEPALLARVGTRLPIADYFLYRLSGRRVAERTMASTTQLMSAATGEWDDELIRAIGDDPARWPPIVAPGTVLGRALLAALPNDARHVPLVVASCSHDTAAAVAAIPAAADVPWAFISSGTWSLVGAELDVPILSDAARAAGFTNEAGLDGTVRFLKNRTGMWVLEECVREWAAAGERATFDALVAEAADAPSGGPTVDLNAPELGERGDMPAKLERACDTAGVRVPETRGALVRLVLESLARSYAATLDELDALTGRRSEVVHVVGGGSQNALLSALTAAATGRPVVAGPSEATVLGNLLVQARTLGDLPADESVRESVRETARRSVSVAIFSPDAAAAATIQHHDTR